jgi:transposase
MACEPTIKTDHADLLNALEAMQRSPIYALRRSVLRQAEQLIFAQERRIKELEDATACQDNRTAEALRYFLGAAYVVDTTIHQRGYNWSEAYLDQARAFALANP